MVSYRRDPYLWVHLAGLAAVPVLALLCLLLLAAGDPLLPSGLEIALLALVGIGPVLWMQLRKPFYIYALLVVAERPESLTEAQRRLLPWFRSDLSRTLAIAAVVPLFWLLWKLYDLSPIASGLTPFAGQSRLLVLLLAAGVFLLVNLFAQVPLSVLRLLLVGDQQMAATPPCELAQIRQEYTILGWPIRQILPQAWLPENQPRVAPDQLPEPPSPSESESAEGPATETVTPPAAALPAQAAETAAEAPPLTETEDVWGEIETPSEATASVVLTPSEVGRQPQPDVAAEPVEATEVVPVVESVLVVEEATPAARDAEPMVEVIEHLAHEGNEPSTLADEAVDVSPSDATPEPADDLSSGVDQSSGAGAIAPAGDNLELLETVEPLAQDATPLEISASPSLEDTDETLLSESSSLVSDQQPTSFEDPLEDALLHEVATAEDSRVEEAVATADEAWGEDQAETACASEDEWVETVALDLEENWVDEQELESEEPWVDDLAQPEPFEEQDTENPTI